MRLLFITPGFPSHEADHNCIPPLQMLVRNLLRRGVSIDIITLDYPFHRHAYRWHAARVFPCNGRNRRWMKLVTYLRAIYRFVTLTEEGRFDYVHAFWLSFPFNLVRGLMSGEKHTTWFATAMGQDVMHHAAKIMKSGGSELAPRLVVLSEFHNQKLEEYCGFRADHVIPWGYPEEEIPKSLPAERPIDLLGVGSLIDVKNWSLWLEVLHGLVQKKTNLRAEILGDGYLGKAFQRKVDELGLSQNLTFQGDIPRPEVLKIMQQSKVLLHTSEFESFGMVLVEGLANGCRVVSTPVGIAPEIEQIETGETAAELLDLVLKNFEKTEPAQSIVPIKFNDVGWKYWDLYHT